jgi:hypothetical protein
LNRLNPTTYNYKDNSDQRYGFIAQEVEKIYPDMVKDGPNGMKSLRYDDIIPLAVGNIQNLNKQVQPDRLCIGNTCVSEQELKQLKFLLSQN